MRVLELRRLSTAELAERANKANNLRRVEAIRLLPKEKLSPSKVHDPIFNEPIKNYNIIKKN
jgi:hypothetical protein